MTVLRLSIGVCIGVLGCRDLDGGVTRVPPPDAGSQPSLDAALAFTKRDSCAIDLAETKSLRLVGQEAAPCQLGVANSEYVFDCSAGVSLSLDDPASGARQCSGKQRIVIDKESFTSPVRGSIFRAKQAAQISFMLMRDSRSGYWGYVASGSYAGFGEAPGEKDLLRELRRQKVKHSIGQCGPLDESRESSFFRFFMSFASRDIKDREIECVPKPWEASLWSCSFLYNREIGGGETTLVVSVSFTSKKKLKVETISCSMIG